MGSTVLIEIFQFQHHLALLGEFHPFIGQSGIDNVAVPQLQGGTVLGSTRGVDAQAEAQIADETTSGHARRRFAGSNPFAPYAARTILIAVMAVVV